MATATQRGSTPFRLLDVDESEEEIKASPGVLNWLYIHNNDASAVHYIKLYDLTAANCTVGTSTPVMVIPVEASVQGVTLFFGEKDRGLNFANGICIAALTGVADADTTGAGTNEVVVSGGYW